MSYTHVMLVYVVAPVVSSMCLMICVKCIQAIKNGTYHTTTLEGVDTFMCYIGIGVFFFLAVVVAGQAIDHAPPLNIHIPRVVIHD